LLSFISSGSVICAKTSSISGTRESSEIEEGEVVTGFSGADFTGVAGGVTGADLVIGGAVLFIGAGVGGEGAAAGGGL